MRLDSQPHIFQNGERKEDICELEGPSNTQLGPEGRRKGGDVASLKKDPPSGRAILPGDHIKKSGFSGPIRADNGFECVRWDFKIDVIYGDVTTETDGKVFGFNDWGYGHACSDNSLANPRQPLLPTGRQASPKWGRISPALQKGRDGGFDHYFFTRIGGAPSSGEISLTKTGTAQSLSGLTSNLKIYID